MDVIILKSEIYHYWSLVGSAVKALAYGEQGLGFKFLYLCISGFASSEIAT